MLEKSTLLEQVIQAWQQLQAQQPLVQCITNNVATNYTANILLAAGASPAMIDNPYEAEIFTHIAAALSINLGTPTNEQMQAMQISAKTAQLTDTPWVLDPVGYGAILKWRSNMVDDLLQYHPTIIRGNASEISTLAGHQAKSKGVDSTLKSADVYHQAKVLLKHADCIAISGESDFILTKELDVVIQVNGGSYLQPKVTATGCALGALIAAYEQKIFVQGVIWNIFSFDQWGVEKGKEIANQLLPILSGEQEDLSSFDPSTQGLLNILLGKTDV